MFPGLSPSYRSDIPPGYSIFISEHLIGKFSWSRFFKDRISYCYNLFLGKYGSTMVFSETMSFLENFILVVFGICSKPEMVRIYTDAIIAFMQNMESMGNYFFRKYPGNSMRTSLTSAYDNVTVSFFSLCARPFPAIFSFINSAPEFFVNSFNVISKNVFDGIYFHFQSFFSPPLSYSMRGRLVMDSSIKGYRSTM